MIKKIISFRITKKSTAAESGYKDLVPVNFGKQADRNLTFATL